MKDVIEQAGALKGVDFNLKIATSPDTGGPLPHAAEEYDVKWTPDLGPLVKV